jgi:DNA-binding transcriptional ArsR family regulator
MHPNAITIDANLTTLKMRLLNPYPNDALHTRDLAESVYDGALEILDAETPRGCWVRLSFAGVNVVSLPFARALLDRVLVEDRWRFYVDGANPDVFETLDAAVTGSRNLIAYDPAGRPNLLGGRTPEFTNVVQAVLRLDSFLIADLTDALGGLSRQSVSSHLTRLLAAGFLTRYRPARPKGGNQWRYQVDLPAHPAAQAA